MARKVILRVKPEYLNPRVWGADVAATSEDPSFFPSCDAFDITTTRASLESLKGMESMSMYNSLGFENNFLYPKNML